LEWNTVNASASRKYAGILSRDLDVSIHVTGGRFDVHLVVLAEHVDVELLQAEGRRLGVQDGAGAVALQLQQHGRLVAEGEGVAAVAGAAGQALERFREPVGAGRRSAALIGLDRRPAVKPPPDSGCRER
jgi:hypothetical protein